MELHPTEILRLERELVEILEAILDQDPNGMLRIKRAVSRVEEPVTVEDHPSADQLH